MVPCRWAVLAAALLLGVLAAPPWALAGAGSPPAADECKACGGEGLVACKACRRDACPARVEGGEEGGPGTPPPARFCSVALGCEACEGLSSVPCRRCDGAAAREGERAARRAAIAAWREEVGRVDAFLGRPLLHAESEHFRLTYDLGRVDAPGGKTAHGGMHLYLERLEALFARFAADVSARSEDFLGRTHVLLWSQRRDQERASLEYTRQPSSTESKLMGASPVVSILYDPDHLHEEFEMHQAVVHQVAHCLLSNVFDGIWPGNIGAGWIDAGLAHHYEIALFEGVRHYCYVESDTLVDFRFGRWEPEVRAAVAGDEALPFLQVAGRNTGELSPEQHMFAWSFVDFVLRAHPGRFGVLARALKAKRPLQEALEQSLQLSPFEFEAAWKAFVLERYSPRAR